MTRLFYRVGRGIRARIKASLQKALGGPPRDAFAAQADVLSGLGIEKPTIFDVGANVGQSARRYRAAFPSAAIYCFEPFPESFRELEAAVADDPGIHPIPTAVGAEPGESTFFVNARPATNSLLPRPETGRRYYPKDAATVSRVSVAVTTVDRVAAENGIDRIQVLKLDVQGAELMALIGAQRLLNSNAIDLIFSEIQFIEHYQSAPLFHDLWGHLTGLGYSLFDVYDLCRAQNGQLRFGNALFVSPRVRGEVLDRFESEP